MNEGRRGLSQKPRTGEMRTRGPAIARDHRNNIMTYRLLRAVLTAMVLSGAWASIPSASNAAMEGREVLDLLNRAKGGDTQLSTICGKRPTRATRWRKPAWRPPIWLGSAWPRTTPRRLV